MPVQLSYKTIAGNYETVPITQKLELSSIQCIRQRWATRQQHHTPGFYAFSTLKKHVYYESYLESTVLLHLDYGGEVTYLVEQPFVIHDRKRQHIPDFVVQYRDHHVELINVKPAVFRHKPAFEQSLELVEEAAQARGWTSRVFTELGRQYVDNLEWLAGYRGLPYRLAEFSGRIVDTLQEPLTLRTLVAKIGEPFLLKPVVFHLIWHRRLCTNLDGRFSLDMPIWRSGEHDEPV